MSNHPTYPWSLFMMFDYSNKDLHQRTALFLLTSAGHRILLVPVRDKFGRKTGEAYAYIQRFQEQGE